MTRDARTDGPRLAVEMILPALPRAGMEMVVANLVGQLRSRGHRVGVTCLEAEGPLADALRADGVDVTVVPAPGVRSNVRAPALEEWLRTRRPDVVHTHSGVWLKAVRAARRASVPQVVHTVHGLLDPEPWYGPTLMRMAARYTNAIVAVSEPLQRYLNAACGPSAQPRIVLLPNGVDTERFAPSDAPGSARGQLVFGHAARLAPIKNQALLLDAFRLVADTMPNAVLRIAGEGQLRADLEGRSRRLGLGEQVQFDGLVDEIDGWMRSLDVFVLSSDAEGAPMSILEAQASRVCVVSTAVGGIPDILDHGRAGVLTPVGDRRALADAMIRVAGDPGLRATLAAAGRERALTSYSEDVMVSRYEMLYRGCSPSTLAARLTGETVSCVG